MTRARDVANRTIVANAVGATELDLTDNYAFTGTVTGAGGGKVLKASVSEIATNTSRASASAYANDLDFGSFTPSATSSTVLISGVAYMDGTYQKYLYYKWVIDGTDYVTGNGAGTMAIYNGTTNNAPSLIPCPITTSVTNTDGSAITVVCQGKLSDGSTLYINRSQTDTYAGAKSAIMFIEVAS